MKRKELERHLNENGCTLAREGAKHSVWVNLADITKKSSVPRHSEIDDYLARAICRQLNIPPVK